MKRLFRQNHGVIMMETLLTLPIYIVLLAGLFWLGDVCLIRLALIEGENFSLWAKGNRHDRSGAGPYIFWFLDDEITTRAGGSVNYRDLVITADGWGQINTLNCNGVVQRSGWSLAANDAMTHGIWGDILSNPMDTSGEIRAYGVGKERDVTIFSRQADTSRIGGSAYENSASYMTIAGSSWDSFIQPSVGSVSAISLYGRNTNFVTWSE